MGSNSLISGLSLVGLCLVGGMNIECVFKLAWALISVVPSGGKPCFLSRGIIINIQTGKLIQNVRVQLRTYI